MFVGGGEVVGLSVGGGSVALVGDGSGVSLAVGVSTGVLLGGGVEVRGLEVGVGVGDDHGRRGTHNVLPAKMWVFGRQLRFWRISGVVPLRLAMLERVSPH